MKILANNNINTVAKTSFKGTEDESLSKTTDKILDKMKKRAEFEVTDVGYFKPIKEMATHPNEYQEISKYGVVVRAASNDKDAPRLLEFCAQSKSGSYENSRIDTIGTRKDILERLNDKNFKEDLYEYLDEANTHFILKGVK